MATPSESVENVEASGSWGHEIQRGSLVLPPRRDSRGPRGARRTESSVVLHKLDRVPVRVTAKRLAHSELLIAAQYKADTAFG